MTSSPFLQLNDLLPLIQEPLKYPEKCHVGGLLNAGQRQALDQGLFFRQQAGALGPNRNGRRAIGGCTLLSDDKYYKLRYVSKTQIRMLGTSTIHSAPSQAERR